MGLICNRHVIWLFRSSKQCCIFVCKIKILPSLGKRTRLRIGIQSRLSSSVVNTVTFCATLPPDIHRFRASNSEFLAALGFPKRRSEAKRVSEFVSTVSLLFKASQRSSTAQIEIEKVTGQISNPNLISSTSSRVSKPYLTYSHQLSWKLLEHFSLFASCQNSSL